MNKSTERNAFSSRLQLALRNAKHPSSHPTHLAREFNFRFSGSPITVHAARKWLVGESIPTQDKLRALSTWLGVTAEWLRFGGPEEDAVIAAPAPRAASESAQSRLINDFMELDEHHRQIVQDFIRMLVEKRTRPANEVGGMRTLREVKNTNDDVPMLKPAQR